MNDSAESDGVRLDPADAFALLGDPVRLAIVTALHDADGPVSFSTLYERVDVDDTGQFNYHRDQLVPHFLRRTDDGHELTASGQRVARAVAAGAYTDATRIEPFALDGACYDCGSEALWAAYEGEHFRIECRDCDRDILELGVPPSVVRGRGPTAVADAVDRWFRAQVDAAARGLCPSCGGPVESSVTGDVPERIEFEAVVAFDCRICNRRAITSFGALAYGRGPSGSSFGNGGNDPASAPTGRSTSTSPTTASRSARGTPGASEPLSTRTAMRATWS